VLSCELPLSYMYVCRLVCQTRALLHNRFDNCSLYMRSSSATSAETSAAGVRTDDISATRQLRTRSASVARRTAATSGSSDNRLRLRGGTLVGRQRRLSWHRSAWVRVPFLTGRVEERPVGKSAVGVRQRRRHQPRLPQDTCTMFPAGRCHWR